MNSFSVTLTRALQRGVPQKHVRKRISDGKELSYVEGWFVVAEANRIFGFDGWDRETVEVRCVQAREIRGIHSVLYTARVRILVRFGDRVVTRDGCGTGEGHGSALGESHDLALKAAVTDATKRALVTFGKAFGLTLHADRKSKPKQRRREGTLAEGAAALVQNPEVTHPAKLEPTEHLQPDQVQTDEHLEHAQNEPPVSQRAAIAKLGAPMVVKSIARTRLYPRGRIDKSQLALNEPRRVRDKSHLRFVTSRRCVLCGRLPSDAHHVRFAQPKALGSKVSDEFTVPLCRDHHRELHDYGDERGWWHEMGLEPLSIARLLWEESHPGIHVDPRAQNGVASTEAEMGRASIRVPRIAGTGETNAGRDQPIEGDS